MQICTNNVPSFFSVHVGCGIVYVYKGWERTIQWEPVIAQPPPGFPS